MPSTLNAPGIYIEELDSGVHPIVGVSTSDTAFVDWFPRGPVETPTRITSFDGFTRTFGGLSAGSQGSYAIYEYFLHGGAVAWVVRAELAGDVAALKDLKTGSDVLYTFTARNAGSSGNSVRFQAVKVSAQTFNLHVEERSPDGLRLVAAEVHRNISSTPTDARYFVSVVNADSTLVAVDVGKGGDLPVNNPSPASDPTLPPDPAKFTSLAGGADADLTSVTPTDLGTALVAGMQTLTTIEPFVFNLLCMPALPPASLQDALTFCEDRYAFMLVDPPEAADTAAKAIALLGGTVPASANGALYWPRISIADPAAQGRPRELGPCGAVAGVFAKTDATRGVWKAPAGIEATLGGLTLAATSTESDSQVLNPVGINALRVMPVIGNVVWGARTLFGADVRADQWKYVPVRRTALYIELSLRDGLQWVVFEPNDEPLWAQVRLNVGSFLQDLFRKQAFQGTTPRDAYFVRCDKNTTTQSDIDKGIVNILVGFAPLRPAEFVVIQIQQMVAQATS